LSSSISKVLSFIAASLNSFILNKTFTFKVRKFYIKQPIRFFILYSISLIFNSLVHDLFKQSFDGLIPFGIATFVSVIINFFGQKLWVFRKS
jgi:putative flippase GtrA